jgi:hypothetical protein
MLRIRRLTECFGIIRSNMDARESSPVPATPIPWTATMISMFRALSFVLMVGAAGVEVDAQPVQVHGLLSDYYPAFCSAAAYPTPRCSLVIFREDKRHSSIDLPLRLEFSAYNQRGTAIYSLNTITKPTCLHKIELNPVRATSLTCPPGLSAVYGFAVSVNEDRLLVSGQIKEGSGNRCGVFEIRLPEGATKHVLGEDCTSYRFEDSWTSLSLSPDTEQAVAVRRDRLELVRIADGISRVVAEGISKAAWSPDGRWIAALDVHGRTELFDTKDFKRERTLAESEVQWSPDSRYLLRIKSCLFPIAVNGVGTVQALDVATGKIVTIESSRCMVDAGSTGWVSSGIVK